LLRDESNVYRWHKKDAVVPQALYRFLENILRNFLFVTIAKPLVGANMHESVRATA